MRCPLVLLCLGLLAAPPALAHEVEEGDEEATDPVEHTHVEVKLEGSLGPVDLVVDDALLGTAPVADLVLAAGTTHSFDIDDGCLQAEPVRIAMLASYDETVTLQVEPKLRKLEVITRGPSGELAGATVVVDGEELGVTPGTFEVDACAKRIEVTARSTKPWSKELEPGEEPLRLVADLSVGRTDPAGIPIVGTAGGALLKKAVKIVYPADARRAGLTGVVRVRILLDERGKVMKRTDDRCLGWDDGSAASDRTWHSKFCAWGTGPTQLVDAAIGAYLKVGFHPYKDPDAGPVPAWLTAKANFGPR